MRKRKMYLSVEDIAELFELSVSFAYRVVERMNADLASKNYYVILGRVPTRYVEDNPENDTGYWEHGCSYVVPDCRSGR